MKLLRWTFLILFMCVCTQMLMAQDWANLERFRDENTKLMTSRFDKKRIVFMGNSITEGWSNLRPEFFVGKPYVNRGIGGQVTPQMLLRFRQDVINLKPEIVVILAGINDIARKIPTETIFNNIISMVELAKANKIKVILCSVLPVSEFPWEQESKPAGKVIELNLLLKLYAYQNDIVYLNYFTAMVDDSYGLKKELGTDGVHPNRVGYSVMEPLLEKAISSARN